MQGIVWFLFRVAEKETFLYMNASLCSLSLCVSFIGNQLNVGFIKMDDIIEYIHLYFFQKGKTFDISKAKITPNIFCDVCDLKCTKTDEKMSHMYCIGNRSIPLFNYSSYHFITLFMCPLLFYMPLSYLKLIFN